MGYSYILGLMQVQGISDNIGLALNALQLLAIVGGMLVFAAKYGKREQNIDHAITNLVELKDIVQSLVQADIAHGNNFIEHKALLNELQRRMDRYEGRHSQWVNPYVPPRHEHSDVA